MTINSRLNLASITPLILTSIILLVLSNGSLKDLAELKLPVPKNMLAVDNALIQACDELTDKAKLSDIAFVDLSQHFDANEILEIISVVSLYRWTAAMLGSFHVAVENVLR